jgi:hypothetical protein
MFELQKFILMYFGYSLSYVEVPCVLGYWVYLEERNTMARVSFFETQLCQNECAREEMGAVSDSGWTKLFPHLIFSEQVCE